MPQLLKELLTKESEYVMYKLKSKMRLYSNIQTLWAKVKNTLKFIRKLIMPKVQRVDNEGLNPIKTYI